VSTALEAASQEESSALALTGVVKRYGRVSGLDGMSFEVGAGEFFCLLGPSAAGKTTTLRAIAGLERIEAGRIVFGGRDVTRAPVQGRGMAMIFQTFALYPHLLVRENLAYPLREAGIARAEIDRRVGEIAEMLRIGHTLGRKPETMSGGEQQRLAIGRALIRRPKLLLLDEPLTNLDAKLRHDTRAEFKRLHRELGTTMVYATPDQLEALTLGERVAVIDHGRVVQIDGPRALYARPGSTYVATMVGAPPMNLVRGRTAKDGGTVRLPFADVVDGPWAPALRRFPIGTEILFGFRPHDVAPVAAAPRGPSFPAEVHLTEPLGDVTVLDLKARGLVFKMVLPEDQAVRYALGQRLEVGIQTDHSHVFALDTGTAIR
jgi:multiple sugar transport system ATP-binding protein